MWGSTVTFITKHCELLQCFQHDYFFFFWCLFCYFFSSKIVSVDFFFNIELIKNLALLFFFFKTLWIVAVFSHVIFLWFFPKLSLSIFFLNIELVKNYNYNKAKSYEESVIVFLIKHCGLLQYFSKWFFILFYWKKRYSFSHKTLSIATTFFLMGFFPSKIIFVGFFF